MTLITVKPKAGLTVRKPDSSKLSADGEQVKRNAYWLRRINDGDVTVVQTNSATSTKKAVSKK